MTRSRYADEEISPRQKSDAPWRPSAELRRIVREAAADPRLLVQLTPVREAEINGDANARTLD